MTNIHDITNKQMRSDGWKSQIRSLIEVTNKAQRVSISGHKNVVDINPATGGLRIRSLTAIQPALPINAAGRRFDKRHPRVDRRYP